MRGYTEQRGIVTHLIFVPGSAVFASAPCEHPFEAQLQGSRQALIKSTHGARRRRPVCNCSQSADSLPNRSSLLLRSSDGAPGVCHP
jgi:hypothetical protein